MRITMAKLQCDACGNESLPFEPKNWGFEHREKSRSRDVAGWFEKVRYERENILHVWEDVCPRCWARISHGLHPLK